MGRFLYFILIIIFFTRCSSPEIYSYDEQFTNHIWNRFDLIELEVPIGDEEALYDLAIDFIHTQEYPSDHIAINFTVYFSSGGMRSRDYEFKLKDIKQQWTGQPIGEGYHHVLPLISSLRFPEKGVHRIRIESKMTKFDLPGVESVGFKVLRSKD